MTARIITVNCASIPRELFASEFFGHVKGAFTGALGDRIGRFQLADKGTLFLDEVGEIPLELQSKLLRGSYREAPANVSARTAHAKWTYG
jgi:transcriptional regulator with GAF, ATPase, and Fis domain